VEPVTTQLALFWVAVLCTAAVIIAVMIIMKRGE
jgi:hypothetical protein